MKGYENYFLQANSGMSVKTERESAKSALNSGLL